MSNFVNDLVEWSKQDRVELFRIDSVPVGINTENFDRVRELLVGDRWLKEFVDPPLDDTPASRKRYTQSVARKRRRFRMVLARNLAAGIYDCDFVEKLTTLEKKLASGELKASENHEYYSAVLNEEMATLLMNEKSERVSGENNAGAGHDGRYSPYSVKFVGYDGMTSEEKEEAIAELYDKRIETVKDNPQNNPKRPEYYMSRLGVNREEAVSMVSESQATFSLSKCIDKYGEEEGTDKWKERQDKWKSTLDSAPLEEQYTIARKKASSVGKNFDEKDMDNVGKIYIMRLSSGYTKIGHTNDLSTRTLQVGYESGEVVEDVKYFKCKNEVAYDVEDFLVTSLKRHSVFMHGNKINGVRSTEYFYTSEEFDSELNSLLDELVVILESRVKLNSK